MRARGFTLIELLVVLAIVGTLLMLAVPRYSTSVERSREAVLKQNLVNVRDALDKYYSDKGRYPESLEALVTEKYLRAMPLDPVTQSTTTWLLVPPEDALKGGIADVRSGAPGNALDGTAYAQW